MQGRSSIADANVNGKHSENMVADNVVTAGVTITKWEFHVIHRVQNKKAAITKFINRQDTTKTLQNKNQLRETDIENRQKLKTT